jgi:hypothetical protein
MLWGRWDMSWRQRSESGWNGIKPEHIVMVPKAHRFAVDDQIVLHLLSLGLQPVVLRDASIERLASVGIAPLALLQLSDGMLDGGPEGRHFTQQGTQSVAITPRLAGNLLQNFALDRCQRVAWLCCSVLSAMLLFQALKIEAASDSIKTFQWFAHDAKP